MKSAKIYSFPDVILAIIISLMGFVVFNWFQYSLQHELNGLFDANQYQKSYEFFRGSLETYRLNYPFSVRILVPWLAAQLPFDDIYTNFKIINLLFGIAWIPVWFYVAPTVGLDRFKTWLGWFWITFHWVGIWKANLSDPITVDLPLYLFQLLLLLALTQRKWWLLILIAPIATIQKESFLPILVVLCLYPGIRWFQKGKRIQFIYLLVALALSFITLKTTSLYFPGANTGKNAIINLFNNTLGLIGHPDLLLRWGLSLSLAYGAFIWIMIWNRKLLIYSENEFQKVLFPLVGVYLFFSLFAGGDFTRIAFLGAPFMMLLFLQKLTLSFRQWIILLAISIPVQRLFEFIPDGGSDFENWKTWYPEYAPWNWVVIYLVYTLLLALISKKYLKVNPS
ncbi:hypothetical protein IFO69_16730 [Echinicola sp. CAU 1574]|uniref:DUF2029 domain-containing protein n=1 Tax=Echinicola arenosa TaxID=2774144 RepID=A0ABR9AR31_9BACT|nr:hypothetical protein [Echinicola arenosa]MBD8490400.1 hypothetical protein [Echinicola arenosa]